MHAAGMIIPLNNALPAVVPIPIENPFVSDRTNNAINVVHNSGTELEFALIVPPRTPSERLRPKYSDTISKLSQAR